MENFFKDLSNSQDSENSLDKEADLLIFFYKLIKRKKLLIIFSLIGLIFGGFYLLKTKPVFKGTFQIVISKPNKDSLRKEISEKAAGISLLDGISSKGLSTEIKILESPSVLIPVFEYTKKLKDERGIDTSKLFYGKWKKKNFALEITPKTNVLNVAYKDTEKEIIQKVLQRLSETYQSYSLSARDKSINNTLNYLINQKKIYENKTIESLKNAREFALKNNLLPPSSVANPDLLFTQKLGMQELTNFGSTEIYKIKSKTKLANLKRDLKTLNSFDDQSAVILFAGASPIYRDFDEVDQLILIDRKISYYGTIFKEEDPLIKKLKYQKSIMIDNFTKQLIKFIEQEIVNENEKISEFTKPQEIISEYSNLLRQNIKNEKTLSTLENQFINISLAKQKRNDPWQLISNPSVGGKPIFPKKIFILILSAFVGFGISAVYVLYEEFKKGTIYFSTELKSLLNYPLIISSRALSLDKDLIFSLSNNFNKEFSNSSILFLPINSSTSDYYKLFFNDIKKLLVNVNSEFSIDIKECSKFDKVILLFASGKSNRREVIKFSKLLSLNENIFGFIFEED